MYTPKYLDATYRKVNSIKIATWDLETLTIKGEPVVFMSGIAHIDSKAKL